MLLPIATLARDFDTTDISDLTASVATGPAEWTDAGLVVPFNVDPSAGEVEAIVARLLTPDPSLPKESTLPQKRDDAQPVVNAKVASLRTGDEGEARVVIADADNGFGTTGAMVEMWTAASSEPGGPEVSGSSGVNSVLGLTVPYDSSVARPIARLIGTTTGAQVEFENVDKFRIANNETFTYVDWQPPRAGQINTSGLVTGTAKEFPVTFDVPFVSGSTYAIAYSVRQADPAGFTVSTKVTGASESGFTAIVKRSISAGNPTIDWTATFITDSLTT